MDKKDIAEIMVQFAESNLLLPYSLVLDAWDKLGERVQTDIVQNMWTNCLEEAIRTYQANPRNYEFNAQAVLND